MDSDLEGCCGVEESCFGGLISVLVYHEIISWSIFGFHGLV